MGRLKLAVPISGGGSNLQAIIDACAQADYPAEIVLVISNNPDAYGLERAQKAGIPTKVINHRDYDSREEFDQQMTKAMEAMDVQLVCLAGFLRLLSEEFINHWHNRMINIHPSLLPAFKGLHVQQAAIDYGAKFSGCTVHYVRFDMDTGPIIMQAAVPIHEDDTSEALAARILEQEHRIYPAAIKLVAEGNVKLDGERAIISTSIAPAAPIINPPLS